MTTMLNPNDRDRMRMNPNGRVALDVYQRVHKMGVRAASACMRSTHLVGRGGRAKRLV